MSDANKRDDRIYLETLLFDGWAYAVETVGPNGPFRRTYCCSLSPSVGIDPLYPVGDEGECDRQYEAGYPDFNYLALRDAERCERGKDPVLVDLDDCDGDERDAYDSAREVLQGNCAF